MFSLLTNSKIKATGSVNTVSSVAMVLFVVIIFYTVLDSTSLRHSVWFERGDSLSYWTGRTSGFSGSLRPTHGEWRFIMVHEWHELLGGDPQRARCKAALRYQCHYWGRFSGGISDRRIFNNDGPYRFLVINVKEEHL